MERPNQSKFLYWSEFDGKDTWPDVVRNSNRLMNVGAWYWGLSILCAIGGVIGGIAVWSDSEGKLWQIGLAIIISSVFLVLTGAFVYYFCEWLVGVRMDIRKSREDTKRLVELAKASAKATAKGTNKEDEKQSSAD